MFALIGMNQVERVENSPLFSTHTPMVSMGNRAVQACCITFLVFYLFLSIEQTHEWMCKRKEKKGKRKQTERTEEKETALFIVFV